MVKHICVIAIVCCAAMAHADPVDPPADDGKSESLATGLSVAGSVAGPAVIAVAIEYGNRYDAPLHAVPPPSRVA